LNGSKAGPQARASRL